MFPPPPTNVIDWANVGFKVRDGMLLYLSSLLICSNPRFTSQRPRRMSLFSQRLWEMDRPSSGQVTLSLGPWSGSWLELRAASV